MIVVDSSALCAILLGEPEAEALAAVLGAADGAVLGAPTLVEASMVMAARKGDAGLGALDALIDRAGLAVVAFTPAHAALAREAFLRFGRRRHPAGLNFGDCCAWALARAEGLPLLYKGTDFARAGLPPALPEPRPPR
jgi:ribonuclease VapC